MTIVTEALENWGLEAHDVGLAAQRENLVYRVDTDKGRFALRLHRPGYRSDAELQSELTWMQYLAEAGLSVPAPVAAADGTFLHDLRGRQADLLTWVSGESPGEGETLSVDDPVAFAHALGAEMARLHDVTDDWTPPQGFTRPDWGRDGLVGEAPLWGRFWEHPDLAPDQRRMLLMARDAGDTALGAMEDADFGLIHADLLSENLLIVENGIGFLDFDDSAFGYRGFELATFLLRYDQRPDFTDIRDALIDGYAARRRIGTDELALFLMLRALTYVGWIRTRMNEPGGAERSVRMIDRALRHAAQYL